MSHSSTSLCDRNWFWYGDTENIISSPIISHCSRVIADHYLTSAQDLKTFPRILKLGWRQRTFILLFKVVSKSCGDVWRRELPAEPDMDDSCWIHHCVHPGIWNRCKWCCKLVWNFGWSKSSDVASGVCFGLRLWNTRSCSTWSVALCLSSVQISCLIDFYAFVSLYLKWIFFRLSPSVGSWAFQVAATKLGMPFHHHPLSSSSIVSHRLFPPIFSSAITSHMVCLFTFRLILVPLPNYVFSWWRHL